MENKVFQDLAQTIFLLVAIEIKGLYGIQHIKTGFSGERVKRQTNP